MHRQAQGQLLAYGFSTQAVLAPTVDLPIENTCPHWCLPINCGAMLWVHPGCQDCIQQGATGDQHQLLPQQVTKEGGQ